MFKQLLQSINHNKWTILSTALIYQLIRIYFQLGLNVGLIQNQYDDQCRRLTFQQNKTMVQPEDLVIYKQTLITQSYDKLNTWGSSIQIDPQSMLLQLNIDAINLTDLLSYPTHQQTIQLQPIQITNIHPDIKFRPFGMRVYQDHLYVINEGYDQGAESVLVFKIYMDQYNITIDHLQMVDLFQFDPSYTGYFNSLEVISPTQLLITQWLPFSDSLKGRHDTSFLQTFKNIMTFLLQLFQIKSTYVFYCTKDIGHIKSQCQKIKNSGQSMNNGIQRSVKHNDRVFVSNPLESSIYYYKLDIDKLEFMLLDQIVFETKVDNIHVDPITDDYYTAGNDLIIEFLKISEYYKHKQSDIYKNAKSTGSVYRFRELEQNGGQIVTDRVMRSNYMLKGMSSAIGYRNIYFVGSVLDDALLVCTKNISQLQ